MREVERYREGPVTNLYTSAAPCKTQMMDARASLETRRVLASLAHSFMSRSNSRTCN